MSIRQYPTLKALSAGETVEIDGMYFRATGKEIQPGDMYIAERNTGPHLLWCREHNKTTSVVFPTTIDYCFDTWECIAVELED